MHSPLLIKLNTMRTLLYPLTILLLLTVSCKKIGKVSYKIRFTTSEIPLEFRRSNNEEFYTQFGDYITSLTPSKFTANIWTIGYADTVTKPGYNNDNQILQYIDQNPDHLPQNDPLRLVDFSNNVTVNFENPVMYGRLRDGILEDKQIDFKYFYFMPYYLYQEIQLPNEYEGVPLNMFSTEPNSTVENNILKTQQRPFIQLIFPNSAPTGEGPYFYFGNTDSTFVANPNGENIPMSIDNPIIGGGTNTLIIRSERYAKTMYHAPEAGETITMSGIVSFNTTDLIQVYAGNDNIPYTSDDVFVYAPKFWERISSKLDIK